MVVIEEIDDEPKFTPEILNILKEAKTETLPTPPKSIEIIPTPSYVLKLKTTNDEKIFVNVCSHQQVPAPRDKSEQDMHIMMQKIMAEDEEENENENSHSLIDYKVPCSLGEKHIETDKSGNLVTCYDCVFNPKFNKICETSNSHFMFQVHLLFQNIAHKYGHEFSETWVKLKNKKYFGEKIQNTRIVDRSGSLPKIEVQDKPKNTEAPVIEPAKIYSLQKISNTSFKIIFNKLGSNIKYDDLNLEIGEERILLSKSTGADGKNIKLADIWLPVKMKSLPGSCRAEFKNKNLEVLVDRVEFL